LDLAYDDSLVANPPLNGVDNITGSRSGDLYVAEDGGNMEINIITPEGVVAPFLRILNHSSSEITGPAFNPAGNRLYFSSQRGTAGQPWGG
jgi:secreted PhoX family phosphatase